jgi:hypothetical protein
MTTRSELTGPPFLDRADVPSREALETGLGPARARWRRLDDWARDTYGLEGELLFFGRDTGWSLRFRRGGKALFTMMPRPDGFGVLVVVGPSAWAGAGEVELSPATRAAWESARPYPDGRWLWIDVDGDAVVDDIERLVALKSPPPRRPRRPALAAR